MIIRGYTEKDRSAVNGVVAKAFGQKDEALLCEALRSGGHMALELVAEDRGRVVGHVALSKMVSPEGWLALAPVSVDPKKQRRGIGAALCQMAVDYANAPVVVLGDPDYYARFGFEFGLSGKIETPFPVEYTGVVFRKTDSVDGAKLDYPAPFMG